MELCNAVELEGSEWSSGVRSWSLERSEVWSPVEVGVQCRAVGRRSAVEFGVRWRLESSAGLLVGLQPERGRQPAPRRSEQH